MRESRRIVQQSVPLEYNRYPRQAMTRFAIVDPEVPEPLKGDRYFAETFVKHTRGANNRVLKKPRIETIPGAELGTVAFADTHPLHGDGVYIDYMKTRMDMRNQGHGRALVDHIAQKYPGVIDFGRVMSPSIWNMMNEIGEQGREVRGLRDF